MFFCEKRSVLVSLSLALVISSSNLLPSDSSIIVEMSSISFTVMVSAGFWTSSSQVARSFWCVSFSFAYSSSFISGVRIASVGLGDE